MDWKRDVERRRREILIKFPLEYCSSVTRVGWGGGGGRSVRGSLIHGPLYVGHRTCGLRTMTWRENPINLSQPNYLPSPWGVNPRILNCELFVVRRNEVEKDQVDISAVWPVPTIVRPGYIDWMLQMMRPFLTNQSALFQCSYAMLKFDYDIVLSHM